MKTTVIFDIDDPKKLKKFKKEYEKYKLIPIYLDPEIVDMTRLWKRFGDLIKKFNSWEEMGKWLKKAKRLN